MPLVSTGSLHWPMNDMVIALFEAATSWLEHGLPIKRLLLVQKDHDKAVEMKGAFAVLKQYYQKKKVPTPDPPRYDIFISYSQKNKDDADFLVEELRRLNSNVKIFIDRQELQPGWLGNRNFTNRLTIVVKL
jgi:hypothetical protein